MNLFMHYTFDCLDAAEAIRNARSARYADDAVVHCRSQEQAEACDAGHRIAAGGMWTDDASGEVEDRLLQGQQSHQAYPHVYFTFLGFTFRPRKALSKQRRLFTSFLPGASADAMKRMRQAVRGWKLNRQTHVTLAALAKQYNPVIQGWWNYYGTFYPDGHAPSIHQHIDRALERWARRKYKSLSGRHKRRSVQWLRKMKNAEPQLFYHWRVIGNKAG